MINILKTEFYKMVRAKSFWVISAISLVFTLINTFTYVFMLKNLDMDIMNTFVGINTSFVPLLSNMLASSCIVYCIFVVIFSVSDFSFGTVKNFASKGFSRENIYFSKYISCICSVIFFIIISVLCSFITFKLTLGSTLPKFFSTNSKGMQSLALCLLGILAYLSVAFMVSFLVRSTGSVLAIVLVFLALEKTIVQLLDLLIKNIFKSNFVILPYTICGATGSEEHLLRATIVLLLFIIVSNFIGVLTFKKRDIN